MARRDNEVAVIGSLVIDGDCAVEIDRAGLSADDFEDHDCKLAFEVIEELRQNNAPFDPIIIAEDMAKRSPGDYVQFLLDAMAFTTTAANMAFYCEQVKDNANRQRFITALFDASSTANYGDWKAEADLVFEMLQDLKGPDRDIITGQMLNDSFLDYYEQAKEDPDSAYCRTGFEDLDRQFGGGMFKSEVYIIGARPGMGKTTLGINIAQNIVNRGGAVLFVSLEMSRQQIQAKRISLETGVRYTKLMAGRTDGAEEAKMMRWMAESINQPFFLTTKNMTVAEIGRHARQIKGLACVIIDYIGLISCAAESRQKPRYEQMTEISAALKAMAKMLAVPVLALCQLNRENTARSDKRPTMADLRDSGAIEQDAGAIILLHRPDYYQAKDAEEKRPEMESIELNVAKNRHAEPGVVRMWWNGNVGKILQPVKDEQGRPVQQQITDEEELPF